MNTEVLALVEWSQPYNALKEGADPDDRALAILSAFQNADKHRELNIVAHGIVDPTVKVSDGRSLTPLVRRDQMIPDGAEFVSFEADVDVEMEGSVAVAMARGPRTIHRSLPSSLDEVIFQAQFVIGAIVKAM